MERQPRQMPSHGAGGTPPRARRSPVERTDHGITLGDDYAWLRAANWQEVIRDPAKLTKSIRGYLEAENAYSGAQLADTVKLQGRLFKEMKARIKEDDSTVPAADGPFEYYTRFVTGGPYDGGSGTLNADFATLFETGFTVRK